MTAVLALLECVLICAATCAAIHFGSAPNAGGAAHLATALERSLALSLSCVVAFYYQQLYDLRAVRTFRAFLARLPKSGGLAFILTIVLWRLIQPPEIQRLVPLLILAALLAVLLPLRALVYGFAALRPFARRNLVLGTGPLARQIMQEIDSRTGSRDVLAGVVAESGDDLPLTFNAPVFRTLEELELILSRA